MKSTSEDKKIGKRLREKRIKLGVRQNFVADKMGISNNHLSELERGKKRWFVAMVSSYEKALR